MKKKIAGIASLLLICMVIVVGILAKNASAIQSFYKTITSLTQQSNSDNTIFDLNVVNNFIDSFKEVSGNRLIFFFLSPEQKEIFLDLKNTSDDIKTVFSELTKEEQRWIIIFQNSNEIRATGGFMGSYSIVEINKGKIVSINTEDIYDADGQFTGYVAAPYGVDKYLSGGKGLRLPDANWHADTVKSAEQIMPFFAFGNKTNIKGIVFVNLDFAKKLLSFLGPIEIPDYNTIVTENNIDEVLRSRRDDFFPGSTQKKHMLSLLLANTRIKILELKPEKLVELTNIVLEEIQNHNLQFYSNNNHIDSIFEKYSIRQKLQQKANSDYLYLVESNVGINKANKYVQREVTINNQDNKISITIKFINYNKKPTQSKLSEITELLKDNNGSSNEANVSNHLAYINYQRIITSTDWKLKSALFENKTINELDTSSIQVNNQEFQQIGILTAINEEETGTLELVFEKNTLNDSIYIQQQPGLSATKYILEYNQDTKEYILENNQLITYP